MYVCLSMTTTGHKTFKVISFTSTCLHAYTCTRECLRLPELLTTSISEAGSLTKHGVFQFGCSGGPISPRDPFVSTLTTLGL